MSYKDVRQILSSVFDSENSALRAALKTEGELLNMVLDETGEAPALRVRLVDFQPVTSIIDGEAAVYADLPNPAEHMNEIYIVTTASGIPLVSRKQAGMYRSDGISWNLLDTDLQADKVYYSGTVHAGNVQDALETLKLMSDVNSSSVAAHSSNASNPHGVTKAQIGLGNVDNTADAAKPVSAAVQTALDTKMTASAYTGAFGNLDSPLLHLPLKKNLLTAQGQSVCTFTRASAATYVDRYGMLKSVAADIPRFTADGLLIEGASTNLLTYSEQFENGAWVKTRASVSANTTSTLDPFGTNMADKLVEDTSVSNSHYIGQNIGVTSGTSYTLSIFVKAAERTQACLGNVSANKFAYFDLAAGNVISSTSGVSAEIKQLANGWFRCTMNYTSSATATQSHGILTCINGNLGYTGDGTSSLYIFGAQLEAMPFATSYIPTTTASLSRAADVCSFPISDNMVKLQQSSGHTFMADVRLEGRFASMDQIALGGDTTGTRHALGFYSLAMFSHNAKGGGLNIIGDIDMLLKRRYGVVYNGSASHMYIDGLFKGSVSSASTSENTSVMLIGSASGGRYLFGTISNLRIYDRALTAEEVRLA